MGIFVADKNQVGFYFESGTYGSTSGGLHWIGLVQNHNVELNPNVVSDRYVGASTQDVSIHLDGAKDYTGNLTYYPQSWEMLQFALGSVGTANGSVHTFKATNSTDGNQYTSGTKNPFISFGIEDAQQHVAGQNNIRTVNGAMTDTHTISWSQGEPVSCDVTYIAQNVVYSSGAKAAITAKTNKPFMWNNARIHIPSGTVYDTMIDGTLSINRNQNPRHYCNGSREIALSVPQNRDYQVTATFDGDSSRVKAMYDQYHAGGSEFNAILDLQITGSLSLKTTLSGCKSTAFTLPSPKEGINTSSITFTPKTIHPIATDVGTFYDAF